MNPIVKLAASALPGERKYILFAGAGVSKDAGIPTAWDLMLKTASLLYAATEQKEKNENIDLEKWFEESEYAKLEYSELIDQLYPNYPDQQHFLNQYLGSQPIGDVHYLIAELARRGIIRSIITTNFDNYLEKALEEKGLTTQVLSNDEDLKHSEPLIHCKFFRIYKPHGTLGRGAIKNTPKDLEKLSPLMEEEFIKILSEHGVFVLGYSGRDKGIIEVFKKRNHNFYPLFWVNPSQPTGEIEEIFRDPRVSYIQCVGASQFLNDFINLQERIKELSPNSDMSPTISDLKVVYAKKQEPLPPKYQEFLEKVYKDIEHIKPDFSKYTEFDDAIVDQISSGKQISYRFIEGIQLACNYRDEETLRTIYEYFGNFLKLYDIPDNFQGSYRTTDFDGNKFLAYEMFVAFIGSLIKTNNWESIGNLLSQDLFVNKKNYGGYNQFFKICPYLQSLDQIRDQRLDLNRMSVSADIIKDHFVNEDLSKLMTHQEFLEADFFLYLRTICNQNDDNLRNVWRPLSCVYLDRTPSYILRSESGQFFSRLSKACGINDWKIMIGKITRAHTEYHNFFSRSGFIFSPLTSFDLNKLGKRP